jgi:hypothetical protein
LTLTFCAVPLSIALTESLLAVALALRTRAMVRHLQSVSVRRELWFWFPWAGLEILAWLHSLEMRAGFGEIRHLLLPVAVFLTMPALHRARDCVAFGVDFLSPPLLNLDLLSAASFTGFFTISTNWQSRPTQARTFARAVCCIIG